MSTLKKETSVFFIILFIFFYSLCPPKVFAAWDCFKNIHKEAISDAISISPTELRNILKSVEASMRKRVDYIQSEPPSNRISYESYYKDILEIAKEKDPTRYEYMGRLFTDITIYAFSRYCPMQVSLCDENKILKRTTVLFRGYDVDADYAKLARSYPNNQHHVYTVSGQDSQMVEFYDLLVNEIVDIWVTVWKDAGRDISGMPSKNTLVRGSEGKPTARKEDNENSTLVKMTIQSHIDTKCGRFGGNPLTSSNMHLGNSVQGELHP